MTQKAERDRAGVAELVSQSKLQHTLSQSDSFTHLVRLLEAVSQTHSRRDSMTMCNTKNTLYSFLNTYYPFECLVLKVYKYIGLYIFSLFTYNMLLNIVVNIIYFIL